MHCHLLSFPPCLISFPVLPLSSPHPESFHFTHSLAPFSIRHGHPPSYPTRSTLQFIHLIPLSFLPTPVPTALPPRTPSSTFTSFHLLFAFIPSVLLSKAKSNLFHTPTFPHSFFQSLVSSFLSFTILPLFLLPLASFLTLLPQTLEV